MQEDKFILDEGAIDYSRSYSGDIYPGDKKASKEQIIQRKADIERAIELAKKALAKAQAEGNTAGVEKLTKVIADLEEWRDTPAGTRQSADSGDGGESGGSNAENTGEGENTNTDSDSSDSSKSADDKDTSSITDTDGITGRDTNKSNSSDDANGNQSGKSGSDADNNKKGDGSDSDSGDSEGPGGGSDDGSDSGDTGGPGGEGSDDGSDSGDFWPGEDDSDSGDAPGKPKKSSKQGKQGKPGKPGDEGSDDGSNSGDGSDSGDQGSDQGDSDGSDGGDDGPEGMPKIKDKKILVDPFSKRIGSKQQLPPDIRKALELNRIQIEDEWEAFKRIVSKLKGKAREAAKQAIKDYMKQKLGITLQESIQLINKLLTESYLTEATHKAVEDMTDDEFNRDYNNILDQIDSVVPVKYSTDVQGRIDAIKADATSTLSKREIDAEDAANIRADRKHAEANQRELNKYDTKRLKGMEAFAKLLYKAIEDQVKEVEADEETYSALDRRHEDDPLLVKKGIRLDSKKGDIPTVDVYLDCSGSWADYHLARAIAAVAGIKEFVDAGKLYLNIYYFSNHVHSDLASARAEGGTTAWMEILENIKSHKTKNVVLVTDNDMSYQALNGPNLIVDGCVWFLWKGSRCPEIVSKLHGRRGSSEFNLLA